MKKPALILLNIVISSIIPLALLFYLRSIMEINIYSMIFISGIFVLTYLIALIMGKGLDKNDLMILKSIKNKLSSEAAVGALWS